MQIYDVRRRMDDHENYVFNIASASLLELSYDSKGYGVKDLSLGLLNLTNFKH